MSGKTEKKLRKVCHDEFYLKAEMLKKQAVENWIQNLLTSPFKNRLKAAWKILKGAK